MAGCLQSLTILTQADREWATLRAVHYRIWCTHNLFSITGDREFECAVIPCIVRERTHLVIAHINSRGSGLGNVEGTRERLCLPVIRDEQSRLLSPSPLCAVWFTGRTVRADTPLGGAPKYLVMPGKRMLGGRNAARADQTTYVVESQVDELVLHTWSLASVCIGQANPGPLVTAELCNLLLDHQAICVAHQDNFGTGQADMARRWEPLVLHAGAPTLLIGTLPASVKDPSDLGGRPNGQHLLIARLRHAHKAA